MSESKPTRILYMEDDAGLARLFQKTLHREGYVVDLASNGEEGLVMYDKSSYDVVVVDHRMPVMTGLEVIRALASRGPLPPTLMITGTGDEATAVEAIKLGADDYIVKDVEMGYLKLVPTVIEEALNNRRLVRERQEALNALAESEKQYREIFHQLRSIMEGTGSVTGEMFFLSLVQHLAAALKVRYAFIGEVAGEANDKIQTLAVWSGEEFENNFEYALAGTPCEKLLEQKECWHGDHVQQRFPEDHLLVELDVESYLGVPLSNSSGKVLGLLTVMHVEPMGDVPNAKSILKIFAARAEAELERKRTEKELVKYQNNLEKLVEQRTAELKAVNEQLIHAEKLNAVGKLTASIAHEFNNPIYGIRNALEQIAERANLGETHKELADMAVRECNRVADLIRKLQDFYRPSPVISGPMDIHQAIDDMILLSGKKFKQRKIKLEKHYAADMPPIEAVADKIKQVVLNLIQNAEEAIPEGGGKITINTETFDDTIKICIQDTGCGISPQNMNSIFEPFFTTKTAVKGTGLGLSVSYGIIKSHGGNILVNSQPGKGTTFTVTLPLKRAV